MKIMCAGRGGASVHVLTRACAKTAEVFVLARRPNPGAMRIATKSFIFEKITPSAAALWALKEGIEYSIITDWPSISAGFADALEKVGVKVATATKEQCECCTDREKLSEIIESSTKHHLPHKITKDVDEALSFAKEIGSVFISPVKMKGYFDYYFWNHKKDSTTIAKKAIAKVISKHGEAYLRGRETGQAFAVYGFSNGKSMKFSPIIYSENRLYEENQGPGTKGMGSYTAEQLFFLSEAQKEEVYDAVKRASKKLLEHGYKGVAKFGWHVGKNISFETMVPAIWVPDGINALSLINGDLVDVVVRMANEEPFELEFKNRASIAKVYVPVGFPKITQPREVKINEMEIIRSGALLLHHNVSEANRALYSGKGRSLVLYAEGNTLEEAYSKIANAEKGISGVWGRKDIGNVRIIADKERKLKESIEEIEEG
ncbi:MAG: hypothetical protein QW035_02110 [Candidatus Anstonellales archaeon]